MRIVMGIRLMGARISIFEQFQLVNILKPTHTKFSYSTNTIAHHTFRSKEE